MYVGGTGGTESEGEGRKGTNMYQHNIEMKRKTINADSKSNIKKKGHICFMINWFVIPFNDSGILCSKQ